MDVDSFLAQTNALPRSVDNQGACRKTCIHTTPHNICFKRPPTTRDSVRVYPGYAGSAGGPVLEIDDDDDDRHQEDDDSDEGGDYSHDEGPDKDDDSPLTDYRACLDAVLPFRQATLYDLREWKTSFDVLKGTRTASRPKITAIQDGKPRKIVNGKVIAAAVAPLVPHCRMGTSNRCVSSGFRGENTFMEAYEFLS